MRRSINLSKTMSCLIGLGLGQSALATDFNLQGYGSIVAGKTFGSDNSYFADPPTTAFYNDTLSFNPDSIIAVQASAKVDSSTEVTLQAVGRGGNNYDPAIEWAYVTHTFSNGDRVSVGKKRLPFFMYSDYLDAAYAYPNLRLPYEIYQLSISTYNGGSYSTTHKIGEEWNGKFEVFYGNSGGEDALTTAALGFPVELGLNEIKGAIYLLENDSLSFRAMYAENGLDVDNKQTGELLLNTDVKVIGAAAKYDNGDFFINSEYIRYDIDSDINSNTAYYVTPGYRFGDYTVYLTHAKLSEMDDNSLYANAMKTDSIGVRYELGKNSALKLEVFKTVDQSDEEGGIFGDSKSFAIAYDFVF